VTAFDKSKPMPDWMQREHTKPGSIRGQRYYRKLWTAQPPWANVKAIRRIYAQARKIRREEGRDVHVDHIFPVCGENISGLHIASNLQIIDAVENVRKSNCTYPGFGQIDMFEADFYELEMQ